MLFLHKTVSPAVQFLKEFRTGEVRFFFFIKYAEYPFWKKEHNYRPPFKFFSVAS